jgi:hypothetical protein
MSVFFALRKGAGAAEWRKRNDQKVCRKAECRNGGTAPGVCSRRGGKIEARPGGMTDAGKRHARCVSESTGDNGSAYSGKRALACASVERQEGSVLTFHRKVGDSQLPERSAHGAVLFAW